MVIHGSINHDSYVHSWINNVFDSHFWWLCLVNRQHDSFMIYLIDVAGNSDSEILLALQRGNAVCLWFVPTNFPLLVFSGDYGPGKNFCRDLYPCWFQQRAVTMLWHVDLRNHERNWHFFSLLFIRSSCRRSCSCKDNTECCANQSIKINQSIKLRIIVALSQRDSTVH